MKKFALFFTFFLFFGFLSAEEVKTGEYDFGDITVTLFEEREPEPKPEPEPEPEKEPEPKPAEPAPEIKGKPKFFYIQPVLGTEFGSMMLF